MTNPRINLDSGHTVSFPLKDKGQTVIIYNKGGRRILALDILDVLYIVQEYTDRDLTIKDKIA